jgi:hypothetical protein
MYVRIVSTLLIIAPPPGDDPLAPIPHSAYRRTVVIGKLQMAPLLAALDAACESRSTDMIVRGLQGIAERLRARHGQYVSDETQGPWWQLETGDCAERIERLLAPPARGPITEMTEDYTFRPRPRVDDPEPPAEMTGLLRRRITEEELDDGDDTRDSDSILTSARGFVETQRGDVDAARAVRAPLD